MLSTFERSRRVVEGRCAGPDDDHRLAAHAVEVEGLRRIHAAVGGQARERRRNGPAPHAFLARSQHDLAGVQRAALATGFHLRREQVAVLDRCDAQQPRVVLHPHLRHAAHPQQVFGPQALGQHVERVPRGFAEARFVPGAAGQARDVEVGAGVVLRVAQRVHARVGVPRAFAGERCRVDGEDVVDLRAQQAEGRGAARLAGTDDQHVERRLPVGPGSWREPGLVRVRDAEQLACDAGFESGQALRSVIAHQVPLRVKPRASRRRPPSWCRW